MSTKMSTDLNVTRPTSRVSRPPGGATTISFGDAPPATPSKPAAVVTPPAAPEHATVAETPSKAAASGPAPKVRGKVGVLVAGVEQDALADAIVRALVIEGIKGTVVAKVTDIASLAYGTQSLSKNVDVVIAAAFANTTDAPLASAVNGTLLQLGTSGKAAVIPAILVKESLLEAKALLPTNAKEWAISAHHLLELKFHTLEVTAATEPVIKEKPVHTPAIQSTDTLLEILRESLKSHGARGIVGFSRKFRIADDNNNGQIDLAEFTKLIGEHALGWTPAQIKAVFDAFDKDKSNTISFDEFLVGARGPINERRKQLVLLAFGILDSDKSGVIELNDIMAKYDATKHPDVISGKRTKEDVLSEFLDTFDTIEKDGRVTPAEFIEYYSNVSASIDNDDYFELMIRNAWHISGGEGWCANSSNRRVLVNHTDGRQTVEEVKNDLGIKGEDTEAIIANLKSQGITDIESIETNGGVKSKATEKKEHDAKAAAATPAPAAAPAAQPRPATGFNPRRQPGGASTFTLG